jgi:hypothetical protein
MVDSLSSFWTPELWINTTILIAVGRALWVAVGKATEAAIFRLSLKTRRVSFRLLARGDRPEEIQSLNVLFVRHGSDKYLQHLASDQERNHGRLQNKYKKIEIKRDENDDIVFEFDIHFHKRIGTQFKLFVDVRGSAEPVVKYLGSHENVYDVGVSSNPNSIRVFFLLKDFAEIETIDGFKNNMIWPV